MRRLAAGGLGLCLVFVLATSTVVIAGRQQQLAVPSWLVMLRLTDCAIPCWIGIWPGRTTSSEAYALVKNTFRAAPEVKQFRVDENGGFLMLHNGERGAYVELETERGIVTGISFRFLRAGGFYRSAGVRNVQAMASLIGIPWRYWRSDDVYALSYGTVKGQHALLYGQIEAPSCSYEITLFVLQGPGHAYRVFDRWSQWNGFRQFSAECY